IFGGANATQPVKLSNVAKGTADTDAVNVKQLNDAVASGVGQGVALAVQYDDANKTGVTLAGQGGTTVSGVKAGKLSTTSTDAVNGRQLHATNQDVSTNAAAIQTNGGLIAANAGSITANTGDIATNKGDITDNKNSIADNQTTIATNAAGIS